jgi:GTPase
MLSRAEQHVASAVASLPPEPQEGNTEYKLKLLCPSPERFQHLVTQMKWRLAEGAGEAIYQASLSLI